MTHAVLHIIAFIFLSYSLPRIEKLNIPDLVNVSQTSIDELSLEYLSIRDFIPTSQKSDMPSKLFHNSGFVSNLLPECVPDTNECLPRRL